MQDAIGPFLRELAKVRHLFEWHVCPKTGRIFARHREYDNSFTVLEVMAWSETGLRYPGGEFEAARAIGLEGIADVVKDSCDCKKKSDLRRGVLVAIGKYDA